MMEKCQHFSKNPHQVNSKGHDDSIKKKSITHKTENKYEKSSLPW